MDRRVSIEIHFKQKNFAIELSEDTLTTGYSLRFTDTESGSCRGYDISYGGNDNEILNWGKNGTGRHGVYCSDNR